MQTISTANNKNNDFMLSLAIALIKLIDGTTALIGRVYANLRGFLSDFFDAHETPIVVVCCVLAGALAAFGMVFMLALADTIGLKV